MATMDDFAGRNCPHCGAIDSLDTDVERGEVACTECAKLVAMGLEESVSTRFNDSITFRNADDFAGDDGGGGGDDAARLFAATAGGGLSRSAAAALAAGLAVKGGVGGGGVESDTEASREARYARATVHPKVRAVIDHLVRASRRGAGAATSTGENPVRSRALVIARTFVGYRRETGERVSRQSEMAAACFQIAAEMNGEPVPLAELRVLDGSLGNIEALRREVVAATRMEATEEELRRSLAPNLATYFLRLLHVQLSRYEEPVALLLRAIDTVSGGGDGGNSTTTTTTAAAVRSPDLMEMVEAEKVMAAVLLARTEPSLAWEGRPPYDTATEPPRATAYASFAASAHLNAKRVEDVMRVVNKSLPAIRRVFAESWARHVAAAEGKVNTATPEEANGGVVPVIGVKRERSPSGAS